MPSQPPARPTRATEIDECETHERAAWAILAALPERLTGSPAGWPEDEARAAYRAALLAWQSARHRLDRLQVDHRRVE